ncbi:uncharacterized protein LOC122870099 isoform X3 [Siniperca chuatsi]|uniref:uncharacterized protein LOC122870099 isoform X3 n=1 Tax=Siniperca chuatsi TaxID=119488 RepID=UPI001CE067D0|nr:uncharacterized protein LOC122870099 isoform X3 [Siniperca chuatsi]
MQRLLHKEASSMFHNRLNSQQQASGQVYLKPGKTAHFSFGHQMYSVARPAPSRKSKVKVSPVVINCTMHTDSGNDSDKMDLQLVWTKMGPGERTKKGPPASVERGGNPIMVS